MLLRTRLVLGLLVLATCGLLVADVVTYVSLRSFLYDQLDDSLQDDRIAVERGLRDPRSGADCRISVAPEVYVRVRSDGGTCLKQSVDLKRLRADGLPSSGGGDDVPAQPPPDLAGVDPEESSGRERLPQYLDAPATSGSGRYRVLAELDGGVETVVALPLDALRDTLQHLLLIELLVTAGVLAAIGVLGTWTIRRELRPLEAMGDTADAIAGGDLTRRVEPTDERTEVGRLGLALNAMLGEIEASDQRLRQFVGDASHELRTPLAAVRAYAELFGRGADRRPEDLARAMAGIGRESERMSLLVEDLLLLARLDEHRPLEREPVRLDEVAAEAVDAARTVDPERPLQLESVPATVLGDRNRLRQVLDNLLANVRAHTPAGSPATVRVSSAAGSVVVEVADTGPGLDTEAAEHVFERFYRADESRSRASGGVGLGLSIVQAVAEAHGGTAAVTSEPGHGTTFRIVLPLVV